MMKTSDLHTHRHMLTYKDIYNHVGTQIHTLIPHRHLCDIEEEICVTYMFKAQHFGYFNPLKMLLQVKFPIDLIALDRHSSQWYSTHSTL